MGETLNQLPAEIQVHIKNITADSGLEDNEESYERIAKGWLEKKELFEKQMAEQEMSEIDSFSKEEEKGGIALTHSGSLILVGPMIDGKRKSAYSSIGLRKNVPESVVQEDSVLAGDIYTNEPIEFENGPVKQTSAIFKFAACQDDESLEAQEEKMAEATIILTNEFIDINKAMVPTD